MKKNAKIICSCGLECTLKNNNNLQKDNIFLSEAGCLCGSNYILVSCLKGIATGGTLDLIKIKHVINAMYKGI